MPVYSTRDQVKIQLNVLITTEIYAFQVNVGICGYIEGILN